MASGNEDKGDTAADVVEKTNEDGEADNQDAPEDPWRWVVLAAAFFDMLLNAAVSYNLGVIYVAVLENYDISLEMASWLMAVYSSAYAFLAPVASTIIDLTNCRMCVFISGLLTFIGWVASIFVTRPEWLFLTLAIVGLGQGLAQVGGSVSLAYYFPKRTVFASGIALSGNGLGSFLHPALAQILLDEYGITGTYLILGAICANSCVCGLLMRPTKYERKRRKDKSSSSFKLSIIPAFKSAWKKYHSLLTDMNFLCYLLAVVAYGGVYQTTLVFVPECLINYKGYSHMEAATIASFVGIGSLCSRYLAGFASTEPKIGENLMYIGMNMVAFFLCMVADSLLDTRVGAYTVALGYGVYAGPGVIFIFTLTFYVLGYERGNSGYGIVLFVFGSASLAGPPLYAIALKTYGYGILFKITGVSFLISAMISTQLRPHRKSSSCDNIDDIDYVIGKSKNPTGAEALLGSQIIEMLIPAPKGDGVEGQSYTDLPDDVKDFKSTCKNFSLSTVSLSDKGCVDLDQINTENEVELLLLSSTEANSECI